MTDTEQKALALVNAVKAERNWPSDPGYLVLLEEVR